LYCHIGDVPTVNNNGDILRQQYDIPLAAWQGKRLRHLSMHKIVEPGRESPDDEVELSIAAQLYIIEDGHLHQLTDVDLLDEYSHLNWYGDLPIDTAAVSLRVVYACSEASTWGLRVYGVFE